MAEHKPLDIGVVEDVNRPAAEGSDFCPNLKGKRKPVISD